MSQIYFKSKLLTFGCFLYLTGCNSQQKVSLAEQEALTTRAFSQPQFNPNDVVEGVASSQDSIPVSQPYYALNLTEAISQTVKDCTLPGLYEAEKQMAISEAMADSSGLTVPVKFSYSFGRKHDVIAKYANERALLSQSNPGVSYIPVGGRTASTYLGKHFYYKANNTKAAQQYANGEKCFFSTIQLDPQGVSKPVTTVGNKYDFINVVDSDVASFVGYPAAYATIAQRKDYLKHIIHYMYYGYCAVGTCSQQNAFAGEYANRLFKEVPSLEADGTPQIIKLYVADLRSEQMQYNIVRLSEDTVRGHEIDSKISNILNTCEIHKNYYDITKNLSTPVAVNGYTFNKIYGASQLVHNILSHDVDGTMLSSQYTPIVLDLGKKQVKTSSLRWGTYFNMAALPQVNATDGYDELSHQTAWLGGEYVDYNIGALHDSRVNLDVRLKSEDGFLVLPNSEGKVVSSEQMFGDNMVVNGQKYLNGFLALQALAGKNCLNTSDPKSLYVGPWDQDLYQNKLKVWIDEDRDGRTDDGELKSLPELGILAINACNIIHAQDKDSFGNGTQLRSTFLMNGPGENLANNEAEILHRLTSGTGFEGEPTYFRLAIDLIFNVNKDKLCKQK